MNGLFYVEECNSTNDEIQLFSDRSLGHAFAVYTFHQTKGRGQYGNSWESLANKNIAFSFALRTSEVKVSDSLFNFYTATILRSFLANMTTQPVLIKWPNDLIISNKKVAGLLIERKKIKNDTYFVIGFGLNVLQENFAQLPNAGSLLTQTGARFDLHETAKKLFEFLSISFTESPSEFEVLDDYHAHLFRKDQVAVFELNNLRQNGIIRKVDQEGYLHIDLEQSGEQKFYFKEIKMLY